MKRLLLIIGLIVGASFSPAYAANTGLCFTTNGSNCIPVGTQPSSGAAWGPLPVTISGASFTATTAATATASAPSYSEGQVAPISQDLSGNLRTLASVTLSLPTIGNPVPSTGIYNGINVGGTLRGVTGLSLGSTYSQTMAIVDASGNQITSFGATGTTSNASSGVATSSTNVPTVGYNYGFNGTTWDQLQVDASKNLKVTTILSPNSVSAGAFVSGSIASGAMVDLLTFQGSKAAGTAAANSLLIGGVYNSSPITLTNGQQSAIQFDANGYAKVNVAAGGAGGGAVYGPTANGSAAANPPVIGGGTSDGTATGLVRNFMVKTGSTGTTSDNALIVSDPNVYAALTSPITSCGTLSSCPTIGGTFPVASPIGGATNYTHEMSGSSTNAVNIKASPGTLYDFTIIQTNTVAGNFRFYDTASSPTCSSATNMIGEYWVQSNAVSPGIAKPFPVGRVLANGLAFCFTGAKGNADNTNWGGTTGDVILNLGYK